MTGASDTRPVRSIRLIARRLGCSDRTARRIIKKGALAAVKLNGLTSPWVTTSSEIDRARRGTERED